MCSVPYQEPLVNVISNKPSICYNLSIFRLINKHQCFHISSSIKDILDLIFLKEVLTAFLSHTCLINLFCQYSFIKNLYMSKLPVLFFLCWSHIHPRRNAHYFLRKRYYSSSRELYFHSFYYNN